MKKGFIFFYVLQVAAVLIIGSCTTRGKVEGEKPMTKGDMAVLLGRWEGKLKVGGTSLRIVFRVEKDKKGNVTALMDSPDQGAEGIPVSRVALKDSRVLFEVTKIRGKFEGSLSADKNSISGNWMQSGLKLPLKLEKVSENPEVTSTAPLSAKKEKQKAEEQIAPWEPHPPYPYKSINVKFENGEAGITLAGTITIPGGKYQGPYPAVVLISGSGLQNRDEEIFGHRPFLVLADYLTRHGIAVLRYDDRGFGESGGNPENATMLDFASDAYAAYKYLKSESITEKYGIGQGKIGLIGHSEGALIAGYLAARHDDISFIVLLAGSGVPGKELLLMQSEALLRASGADEGAIERALSINKKVYETVLNGKDERKAREKITGILKKAGMDKNQIEIQLKAVLNPWYRFFLRYDPQEDLSRVKCPVLALGGSLDLQVPTEENLYAIERALKTGGNTHFKIVELEGLNHLFQRAKTGLPSEYASIKMSFAPRALEVITSWIKETAK